jgi:hypothetical protein
LPVAGMQLLHFIFIRVHRTTDWGNLDVVDYGLISFNAVEALFWFACAVYVLGRNACGHRAPWEVVYGGLFVLFGLTDVVEVFQVSSPLIWVKLFILVPLFVVRHRVLGKYAPRPKLV